MDEYKEYRAEDAETIRRFGVKIKKLEAAARHKIGGKSYRLMPVFGIHSLSVIPFSGSDKSGNGNATYTTDWFD